MRGLWQDAKALFLAGMPRHKAADWCQSSAPQVRKLVIESVETGSRGISGTCLSPVVRPIYGALS